MKKDYTLCPFSKAILGEWCHCSHAKLTELCSGKMACTRASDLHSSCLELNNAFKINSRFILSVRDNEHELTHAQLMKIRCGGLLGMQRVLNINCDKIVNVRDVIECVTKKYGSVNHFPYDEIVQDIKKFKHRK